ncbi:leucine/isoleucine/valine transporter permease subunit [bacterium BMS3Abin05]|nr:leucine/isoleucine/valine transporter permease subunit [bacterium BMS3Abin05]GBE28364.1 leucine/isoleucine/valine transporter permease subunit [bacterium BMS3Bbin03]HDL78823.1 branched-chain amino acid ABC transporter permease [Bacteroidota bacterium]HDZ10881.1 branched-chain amino acid ABC transporter permease [Bacteroidota bacterium]
MNKLPAGLFNISYREDRQIFHTKFIRFWMVILLILIITGPFFLNGYLLSLADLTGIAIIGALGLNILTGMAGQISLGHGAFIGVGAYASALLTSRLGISFWLALPMAGFVAAAVGLFFGIPSLRIKGLYLAIATLASQVIIIFTIVHWRSLTNGTSGILVPSPNIGSFEFDTDRSFYYIIFGVLVLATLYARNLFRTRVGRAFIAIRDNDIAAEILGVNLFRYKLLAFFISSFYAGIAGSLWAHYITIITPEHFTMVVSINYLAMIIIGGLGSVLGSIYGAIFITLLPEFLRVIAGSLNGIFPDIGNALGALREIIFGLTVILFLIYEPNGLYHRWQMIKAYWKLWPFNY